MKDLGCSFDKSKEHPLTEQQRSIYVLQQSSVNNNFDSFLTYYIEGGLDVNKFHASLQKLCEFFDCFRTKIIFNNSEIKQKIDNAIVNLKFSFEDLSGQGSEVQINDKLECIIESFRSERLDILNSFLYDFKLIKLSSIKYCFAYKISHLIYDGASCAIFSKALSLLYNSANINLNDQFSKSCYVTDDVVKADESYWYNKLQEQKPGFDFGYSASKYEASNYRVSLGKNIKKLISSFAKKSKTTPFLVLSALHGCILNRYFSENEFLISYPVDMRPKNIKNIFGHYVKAFPLSINISENISFKDLLKDLTQQRRLDKRHESSFQEAHFSNYFNENYSKNSVNISVGLTTIKDTYLQLNDLKVYHDIGVVGSPPQDLSVLFDFNSENLEVDIKYNGALFSKDFISQMLGHFEEFLMVVSEDDNKHIADINFLNDEELNNLTLGWNKTEKEDYLGKTIHGVFEEWCQKNPNQLAVVENDKTITYKELNERADNVANYLQIQGIKPNEVIGLCLERSINSIVAILGILKSGAAYLPIDSEYPAKRIDYLVQNSKIKVLVTNKKLAHKFSFKNLVADVVYIDSILRSDSVDSKVKDVSNPNNLAYVIYTSGSTGNPKGVMIEHGGVVNMSLYQIDKFGVSKKDNVLQFASLSFDASVYEICMGLLSGGTLVIADNTKKTNKALFIDYLNKTKISVLTLPPAFLGTLDNPEMPYVRTLITAGESPKLTNVEYYKKFKNYINAFGPTEASVCISTYNVNPEDNLEGDIPIGKPISNIKLYILDYSLKPVPVGVCGALYVSGAGVARGYLSNDDLTKQKFIPNPFLENEKMYKTGDLAKFLPGGDIVYLGRMDNQVKIRGYRIELEEISSQLNENKKIKDSVVITKSVLGNQKIVAYYVKNKNSSIDKKELKEYLFSYLPEFMVPHYYSEIKEIPLTTNGKINTRLLPDIDSNVTILTKATTDVEKKLVSIYSNILKINKDNISVDDSFFDLGGDSLNALELTHLIKSKFDVDLDITSIYKHSSIKKISHYVNNKEVSNEDYPLDFQEEIKFIDSFNINQFPIEKKKPMESVFVTGGTGFLGSYLIEGLLDRTNWKIYCLVRKKEGVSAEKRLKDALSFYEIKIDDYLDRIELLEGDLSKCDFGLSSEKFEFLTKEIDGIFHLGTYMDHFRSYSDVKKTDLIGTKNIIKLAIENKNKYVHYFSTVDVISSEGPHENYNEDICMSNEIHYHSSGYTASKWVSEGAFIKARKKGLRCNIYRLPIVIPSSKNPIHPNNQWFSAIFSLIKKFNTVPTELKNIKLPYILVDDMVKFVVTIAQDKKVRNLNIHLWKDKHLLLSELLYYYQQKYNAVEVSLDDWKKIVSENQKIKENNSSYLILMNNLNVYRPILNDKVCNKRTSEIKDGYGIEWSKTDDEYKKMFFQNLVA